MIYTTFQLAKQARACTESYRKFAKHVGGVPKYGASTPIPLTDLLAVCGLDDTLWVLAHCCTLPDKALKLLRLFLCDCADHVLPIYEKVYPKDNRPRNYMVMTRRFLDGAATFQELEVASAATWGAARDIARAVAWAAWETARAAAWATWAVAKAAGGDTRDAWRDARDAEREWQTKRLRELLTDT